MSRPEWISELFENGSPEANGYYSYYEDVNENRIIHGEFKISYTTYSLGGGNYEINGCYNHGKRDGAWIMKLKNHNGKYSNNYLYQFNYRDGLLSGPFHFFSPETEGVEITGQFKNGVISGKVIIRQHCWLWNCYTQLEGPVNYKGNPHGVWTEKNVSEKAIPKDITRLYYDGNLVYRREKDLSSGKIEYTFSVSDEIHVPADTAKISDTIIKGKEYIKVGTIICFKDTNIDYYDIKDRFDDDRENEDGCVLNGVILKKCPMMKKIYPSITNWRTRLDSYSYAAMVSEQEERRKKEARIREERAIEERSIREKAEEEERTRREQQQALKAKGLLEWGNNQSYYMSIFGDSVNFMNHFVVGDWESYANDVIDDEYNGLVSNLSDDIVDRSAKGYKKGMDNLQVNRVFYSQYTYNLARKQGREQIAKDIISYKKGKNKEVWKTIGTASFGVALVVGGLIFKYMTTSTF